MIIIQVRFYPEMYQVTINSDKKLKDNEILAVGNVTVHSYSQEIANNVYRYINVDGYRSKLVGSIEWQNIITKNIGEEVLFDVM